MKQTFIETSDRGYWQRVQRATRRGTLQIWGGAGLVFLLAVSGLAAGLFGNQLRKGELSEQYVPPHNALLQALLYRPPIRVDTVSQGGVFQIGNVGTEANSSQNGSLSSSPPVPRIVSRPEYTAVVGKTYKYSVEVEGRQSTTFQLGTHPGGMTIDGQSGVITWTPDSTQQGKLTVEVTAFGSGKRGTKQTYQLYVSGAPHPLGTERRGRGMGAALLLGARWALLPGCIAVFVSMMLGVSFGGLAGYYSGPVDMILSYTSSLTEAIPSLVLLFLAAVISEFNIFWIMGVLGILRFPRVASSIKTKVQDLKAEQFVEASRELGLRDRVILWRDIIWHNARPELLLHASYGFVFAIVMEVTLSYLRLGIQIPAVSWGNLLYEGRNQLINYKYWPVVLPSLAIILAVASFYLLADGISRRYRTKRAQ